MVRCLMKAVIILLLPLISITVCYGADYKYVTFSEWVNAKPYAIVMAEKEKEEKKTIREQWKEFFRIDFFYPYFKAKEIKKNVEEKSKIRILKLKGRAKIEENKAQYIFSIKF